MKERKSVLLIINPAAGKKRIRYELYGIIALLEEAGLIPTVFFTEYRGHAEETVQEIDLQKYEMVLVCGGDGTLNEVISGLMRSGKDVPIGIIPMGSTCDFANTLGLSLNASQAVKDIVTGDYKRLDIGRFCESYFSYVASFGIFTKASYATNQTAKNLLGRAAYVLEGMKDLGEMHEHKMHVILSDGRVIDDTFLFGAVANSTSIGGIISLNPTDVALDDGEFEYLFVKNPNDIGGLLSTLAAISSYNYEYEGIYFGSTKGLHIEFSEDTDWSLDGEKSTPDGRFADIENIHKAITVIVPKRATDVRV